MNGQNETTLRPFDLHADLPAVKRIWREVGWVDEDDEKYLDDFFAVGSALVATINNEAECCVHITNGTLRLQVTDLPLCAVTAVTTSRIARGHAFAKRLTAAQLRRAADQGALVAALGMFDQGFYDQLGFGAGGYDHEFVFDPATLTVPVCRATPRRLTVDDYELMHRCMSARKKAHGAVVLEPARILKPELAWIEGGFGLGFGEPELTHFVWLEPKGERGPYALRFVAYQSPGQLMELLGLLKALGDQVYSLRMIEPAEIQLQALLSRPFRNQTMTERGKHAAEHASFAWWQLRVLNVPACVAAYKGFTEAVRFNLCLTDPLADLLDDEGWQGVAGDYVVTLGENSAAEPGHAVGLPELKCSVNALTRLLWGVAPASSLMITDDFSAPVELVNNLDRVIHLPTPHTGWDF
jgi:predicted acetyltransferase